MIVARMFGADLARPATVVIGCGEVLLGVWAFTHRFPRACAAVQTAAIVTMNALEISRAPDLLVSAPGMLALNACFLALAWFSAVRAAQGSQPAGLHRAASAEERGQSCP